MSPSTPVTHQARRAPAGWAASSWGRGLTEDYKESNKTEGLGFVVEGCKLAFEAYGTSGGLIQPPYN